MAKCPNAAGIQQYAKNPLYEAGLRDTPIFSEIRGIQGYEKSRPGEVSGFGENNVEN